MVTWSALRCGASGESGKKVAAAPLSKTAAAAAAAKKWFTKHTVDYMLHNRFPWKRSGRRSSMWPPYSLRRNLSAAACRPCDRSLTPPSSFPLCYVYSSGAIRSILGTNDHYHERVCCAPWPLTLTYIFKVIEPWLCNWTAKICLILSCPLCNVYSSGSILSILGTNDHYHERVCRAPWPLTLTYIFSVIQLWLFNKTAKIYYILSCLLNSTYNCEWILCIFGTNDH